MSHTNIFPKIDCAKRTDEGFRAKIYEDHHKTDSPLLKLNIDMIQKIPIADSLHLLHLGLMKRFLLGWRDGTFRKSDTKWSDANTKAVSAFLLKCKMPREIHRAMRSLEHLCYWKGTEYRTFLMYVGIVALKDHSSYEIYQHFLLLFCAVTICETRQFSHLLHLAKALIDHYIEDFIHIYGIHYMTSNFHNLAHMIDDVVKFGPLTSISSYPFENALGFIKTMMKNGNNPLSQIAKRMTEMTLMNTNNKFSAESPQVVLTTPNSGQNVPSHFHVVSEKTTEFHSKIDLGPFLLSTDVANKWFLTHSNKIVCLKNILSVEKNQVSLLGIALTGSANFFERPIRSSALNIYAAPKIDEKGAQYSSFIVADIKCKLVRVEYNDKTDVFIPLLHTL